MKYDLGFYTMIIAGCTLVLSIAILWRDYTGRKRLNERTRQATIANIIQKYDFTPEEIQEIEKLNNQQEKCHLAEPDINHNQKKFPQR